MPRGRTKFRILSDVLHCLPGSPSQVREEARISSGSAWKKLIDLLTERGIIDKVYRPTKWIDKIDERSPYTLELSQTGKNLLEEMDKIDRYLENYT